MDSKGNILVSGVGGSTNVSQSIQNYVASTGGKYYLEVTGDQGLQYSLTVTRGANFDIEPHGTYYQAQPLTGTNGAAGALDPGGNLTVGKNYEGIDFNAPDGQPARIVFLLLMPPRAHDQEVRILAQIARAVIEAPARARLLQAKSLNEVLTLVSEHRPRPGSMPPSNAATSSRARSTILLAACPRR